MKADNFFRAVIVLLLVLMPVGAAAADGRPAAALIMRPERIERPEDSPPLLRDPFNWSREQIGRFRDREPVIKSSSAAGLTLNAIIWETGRALAVINDRITAVGDRVNEATILEIMKEMVIFELAGSYHTLWLEPGFTLPADSDRHQRKNSR